MVSKASDDLPEPLNPVITVNVLRGISTSMFLRLCWRAPRTVIFEMPMTEEKADPVPRWHGPEMEQVLALPRVRYP
jgi:hypothetical protein